MIYVFWIKSRFQMLRNEQFLGIQDTRFSIKEIVDLSDSN